MSDDRIILGDLSEHFATPESVIIDLRGNPLEIEEAESTRKYCESHCKNVTVDEDERLVECKECGRVVDPFAYLLYWAQEGSRRMERLRHLDTEIRQQKAEIEQLKAVLSRERSKVRKINQDAPEVQTWKRQLALRKFSQLKEAL